MFNFPDGGVGPTPGTISLKFLPKDHDGQGTNGVETLPKISIAWVGRIERYRRQTDDNIEFAKKFH